MNISQVKGYIFDLDGTLIDSMPLWYNVDRIFLSEHGINPPDNISEIVKKMTVEQSSKYFLDTFNLKVSQQDIINRIEEIVAENYEKTIPLKDGISELLDYLDSKNIPYGVATATYRSLAVACLTRLGLINRIKFLETCSEIGKGKEFPDIFFKCAELLELPPESIAVVEDSLYCLETAKNHGFFTIAIHDKSTSSSDWFKIENISHLYFYHATELTKYIQKFDLYQKSFVYQTFNNLDIMGNILKSHKSDQFDYFEYMYSTGQGSDTIQINSITSKSNSIEYSPQELLCYLMIEFIKYDGYTKDDFKDHTFQECCYEIIFQFCDHIDFTFNSNDERKDFSKVDIKYFFEYAMKYLNARTIEDLEGYSSNQFLEKSLFNLKDVEIYEIGNIDKWYFYQDRYIGYNKNSMFICSLGIVKS